MSPDLLSRSDDKPDGPIEPASAVVLAGGRSTRLGVEKAFVRLGTSRPLIEEIISKLFYLTDDLVIVANDADRYGSLGARVVGDEFPGAGSLGGIYSGLLAARHARALVVACDMPFLKISLLRYLLALSADFDVTVPRHGPGFLETMHAIYSRACLDPIRFQLARGQFKVIDFYPSVRVRYVEEPELRRLDPELLSFFNVNTPEQLQQAVDIMRRRT